MFSRVPLKMRFFRDYCVCIVLKSSCIIHTFRFSARCILALIARDGMYAGFAGAKACLKKSLFLKAPFRLTGTIVLLILVIQISLPQVQAAEIRDPMEPPAYALQKFREAKWKISNKRVKTTIAVKKPAVKAMHLTSILYSSERKIAIIDDQTLKVGDAIRNARLIKINKGSVRLVKKGKIIVLRLDDGLTANKKIVVERKL